MNKHSHIFFVIFLAVIIGLQLALYIIYGTKNAKVTLPETTTWLYFLITVLIYLTEKYKLLYWYLIFAGLLVLAICSLQVTVFMQAEQWWYKAIRAFAIPFAIYVYALMYLCHPWKVFKRYKRIKSTT